MNMIYSFILPLVIHLLIFCQGMGDTFTGGIGGIQGFNSPRITAAQQREKRLEMMEAALEPGMYSAEVEQMRYNRVMERQMRQIGSRTRRTGF